jgi:hypothetical protein
MAPKKASGHGAGKTMSQTGGGTYKQTGKAKRTSGDPSFDSRNVKQLRKEAASVRKNHCRTSSMKRAELIAFINKH